MPKKRTSRTIQTRERTEALEEFKPKPIDIQAILKAQAKLKDNKDES